VHDHGTIDDIDVFFINIDNIDVNM
jgi:hypothetical protein